MALFEVEALTYYYGGAKHPALQEVNLSINEGEFVLLAGESGCGKSTLLRALSGLVPSFYGGIIGGRVRYRGQAVSAAPRSSPQARHWEQRRLAGEIGFVFQDPENQLVMTGVERELAFGLENTGVPAREIKRRLAEIMTYLNLSALKSANTFALSGGQKQKVVLAAVLAMQPKVLLLDEPTSQLDPVAAEEMLAHVKRLHEDLGLTVVLVEQRLERCLHLADRVLMMRGGRLLTNSSPAEAVVYSLGANSSLIPPLPRLFVQMGSTEIPLTVAAGRRQLLALRRDTEACVQTKTPVSRARIEPDATGAARLLEIKNLFYAYPEAQEPAVRSLSCVVAGGEIVALIGENGGGKSTLLKNICGLLRPQRGWVKLFGRDIAGQKVHELAGSVGYLAQNPNDYLCHDTVQQEVAFGLPSGDPKAAKMVDETLAGLRLTRVKDLNPRDLSGGERQRVALAAVLVRRPRVLLLDEPTRGLDARLKQEMGEYLLELVTAGVAVILVTHDIEFVAEYARRVLIMFAGEIVADGDKHAVLNNSLYYAPQLNKTFRGFVDGVITFQEAEEALKGCCYAVG